MAEVGIGPVEVLVHDDVIVEPPVLDLVLSALGVVLLNTQYSFGFVQSVVYGVFGGLGFMLAICLFRFLSEIE